MNQFGGYVSEKLGRTVHKIIFLQPFDQDKTKYVEIAQRYFDPRDVKMRVHGHEFPVSAKDWVRQRGSKFIQYKDYETVTNYGQYAEKNIVHDIKELNGAGKVDFYEMRSYSKPNGQKLLSKELGANKVAEGVEAAGKGAKMDTGLIVLIAIGLAALMGGVMLGYLGFPALMGQRLVAIPRQTADLILGLITLVH